jgi:hypothetical protein
MVPPPSPWKVEDCTEQAKRQRRQLTLKLVILLDLEETDELETSYASCKRTRADDEFLLVRFQVLCLLFGILATLSSKKQKSASASLFDQRKMSRSSEKQRRRSSELPIGIEMAELTEQSELDALTEDDGLEVV